MSEEFTNRRGHSLAVELEEPVQPAVEPVPAPVQRIAPHRRRHRRNIQLPWKLISMVLIGIVLIAVGTLEIARFSYASSVSSAKQQIRDIVATDGAAASKQATLTSATVKSLGDKLQSTSMSLCPGGLLDNYAGLYPRAKQALTDCTSYRSRVEALVKALNTLEVEAKYLEQLQPILEPLSQPLPDQFAVLASQQENWQSVANGIKVLSIPVDFQTAHSLLLTRVNTVANLWIDIVTASNDQDSTKFNESKAKLVDAYSAVRTSADDFETALSMTQTQLTAAYTALQ